MKLLITGGAGYIGSQMVRQLLDTNYDIVVFDSLDTGYNQALSTKIPLIKGNINNEQDLDSLFLKNKFDAVMHFAGVISMKESTENPYKYFCTNSFGALKLFETMAKYGIKKLIFSSSAGVYGNPTRIPIHEEDPKNPTNPYGESKLMVEKILRWFREAYGLRSISLRYFNAAGATLDGQFGEDHKQETHIIPLACQAALANKEFTIYGKDYQTKDGTCIRDYVHIIDLCQAHLLTLNALVNGHDTDVYNIGPGIGYSNIEVVEMVKKVSGVNFPVKYGLRRPGDADQLIADSSKIQKEFGWQSKYSDLKTIVKSAWLWHKSHPNGY
ncbi:MAG: UDP-glucose 4-epimerase GalE [Candidatus Gottesmanbacteria bacterium]